MQSLDSTIEPLIDEYELARILNRSVASLRRDRQLRQGCPYVKIGALIRYQPYDVRAFLKRNRREVKGAE